METSILIAKIIGVIYFSFGIGILFNKKYYSKTIKNLLDDSTYLVLGGILAVIFGLFIIEFHNNWVENWTVIITVIGWVVLLKGVLILAFPKSLTIFKPLFKADVLNIYLAPLIIIFGIIFLYFGVF